VTSYHVRVLKFSPFEPDHFVSAGKDSIRCYRMRGDEIRGISIKMQVCGSSTGVAILLKLATLVVGSRWGCKVGLALREGNSFVTPMSVDMPCVAAEAALPCVSATLYIKSGLESGNEA
jgi:hypothetical protein